MMFTDLPWDLKSEIFSRVPATTLSRLRSTCKRWYALFKDPIFVKKNLGKAATQVILKKGYSVYSVRLNIHGINTCFDSTLEFTGKLKSRLKDSKQVKISEIFHCNGLLLCTTEDNRLVVHNPCIGQTRWIPSTKRYAIQHEYFLGYENNNKSCHSYKILRVGFYYNEQKIPVDEFEIYEFSSDSWKLLDGVTPNCSILSNGVTLKGNTYWFASDKDDASIEFILMFDFTRERFGRLSLPYQGVGYFDVHVVLSVVGEEKLALLLQGLTTRGRSLAMKIWMTNTKIDEGKDLSWSNFLEVDFRKLRITSMRLVRGFLLDEENKMAVCCDCDIDKDNEDKTRIYVLGKNIREKVYKESTKGSFSERPPLVTYVPSLVQVQQGKCNFGGK